MITIFLLWLTLTMYSLYFAGHLFDILANVPNWKSGIISDVSKYRDFYVKSSPKNYFLPLVLGTPIISLITMVMVWKIESPVFQYISVAFLISVITLLLTIKYFVPINEYIFTSPEYDPVTLKEMVSKWVKMDYMRLFLIGVGMLSSIFALVIYYN